LSSGNVTNSAALANSFAVLQRLKELPCNLEIPLPEIIYKRGLKTYIHTKRSTGIFKPAFLIGKN
jgi:hypothetical protein